MRSLTVAVALFALAAFARPPGGGGGHGGSSHFGASGGGAHFSGFSGGSTHYSGTSRGLHVGPSNSYAVPGRSFAPSRAPVRSWGSGYRAGYGYGHRRWVRPTYYYSAYPYYSSYPGYYDSYYASGYEPTYYGSAATDPGDGEVVYEGEAAEPQQQEPPVYQEPAPVEPAPAPAVQAPPAKSAAPVTPVVRPEGETADVYRFVDANGVETYSNAVPPEARGRATKVTGELATITWSPDKR